MNRIFALHSARVSYYYGGAERFILNFLEESFKQKKNIVLVTYDAPQKSEWFLNFYKKHKSKIILLNSKELEGKFSEFKKATKPVKWDHESQLFSKVANEFYTNNNFTDISYHYAVDCFYANHNKKIHLHLHGLPDKARAIEKKAIKKVDSFIAVSKYVGKGWKKLYGIKNEIQVVYNGINSLNENRSNKRNNDLVYFGRLIKIKGIDTLLKAIKLLQKGNLAPKVIIIGEGPEEQKLRSYVVKNSLNAYVKFLGRVSDQLLDSILKNTKIAIFPSYKREGIMTTLLEAMNQGCTVITTNACSNNEIILEGKNGIFFPPKNEIILAKKIKELLNNPNLMASLNKNSKKTLTQFTWEKQTKLIWKFFIICPIFCLGSFL